MPRVILTTLPENLATPTAEDRQGEQAWAAYVERQRAAGQIVWSGLEPPPRLGARVHVHMNRFGYSTVEGYFVDAGFLGLLVRPDTLPDWYVKQEPKNDGTIGCFGNEQREVLALHEQASPNRAHSLRPLPKAK